MRCDRCTEDFDHHCKYLNNCIGARNYEAFFRILFTYTTYNINMLLMAGWALRKQINHPDGAKFIGSQWGIIITIVVTVLVLVAVAVLMGFHCYISVCEETTTYDMIMPSKKSSEKEKESPRINVWDAPVSDDRLRDDRLKPAY